MPPWLGSSQRVVTALPRVKKRDAFGAVGVGVTEEGVLPAAEGVVGHGDGDRDVDADHAHLDLVLEAPGRAAVVGEDGGAIAVRIGVDQFEGLVVALDPDHGEDRAEDLVGVDGHLGRDVVEQGGAQEEAVASAVGGDGAPVDDERGAGGFAGVDVAGHLVPVRPGDQRAHVAAAQCRRRSCMVRGALGDLGDQLVGDLRRRRRAPRWPCSVRRRSRTRR